MFHIGDLRRRPSEARYPAPKLKQGSPEASNHFRSVTRLEICTRFIQWQITDRSRSRRLNRRSLSTCPNKVGKELEVRNLPTLLGRCRLHRPNQSIPPLNQGPAKVLSKRPASPIHVPEVGEKLNPR